MRHARETISTGAELRYIADSVVYVNARRCIALSEEAKIVKVAASIYKLLKVYRIYCMALNKNFRHKGENGTCMKSSAHIATKHSK